MLVALPAYVEYVELPRVDTAVLVVVQPSTSLCDKRQEAKSQCSTGKMNKPPATQ